MSHWPSSFHLCLTSTNALNLIMTLTSLPVKWRSWFRRRGVIQLVPVMVCIILCAVVVNIAVWLEVWCVLWLFCDIEPQTPKKKTKKHVRRRIPSSSNESEDKDTVTVPTSEEKKKKKRRFPVSDPNVVDMKYMFRSANSWKKPWIELVAKQEFLKVTYFYQGENNLVSKMRKVPYPKPGHALILSDE